MKLDLTFAELHTPLFLGGVNWGLKLDAERNSKGKIELAYDRANSELLVSAGGKVAIIPTSNVVSMTPKSVVLSFDANQEKKLLAAVAAQPPGKIVAQVETPMDHVFKGPGRGKKNDKA